MACKVVIGKARRVACVGSMRDRITIQGRSIVEPEFGSADYAERFKPSVARWASVETVVGKTTFGGVAVGGVALTHKVTIRFDPCVTTESWILLGNGKRLDVVTADDLDERHEFLVLMCQERGDSDLEGSRA